MSVTDEPITEPTAEIPDPAAVQPPAVNRVNPLRDKLRAARAAGFKQHPPLKLEIPGYEGLRLWASFRVNDDYVDNKQMVAAHEAEPDADQQELAVAAESLLRACVGVFAMDGDTRIDVTDDDGQPILLGKALCDYLGIDSVDNDLQAMFALYPGTMSIATSFARLEKWAVDTGQKVDAALLGN